jgi:hypothetical protein
MKIHDVPRDEKGPIAVLGPGTGLGEAQLFWDDATANYKVQPSEGSHATFAPRGWKQRALQALVEAERGHCSVERVACGSGLVRIYNFLLTDEQSHRPTVVHMEDPTPASVSPGCTGPIRSHCSRSPRHIHIYCGRRSRSHGSARSLVRRRVHRRWNPPQSHQSRDSGRPPGGFSSGKTPGSTTKYSSTFLCTQFWTKKWTARKQTAGLGNSQLVKELSTLE